MAAEHYEKVDAASEGRASHSIVVQRREEGLQGAAPLHSSLLGDEFCFQTGRRASTLV